MIAKIAFTLLVGTCAGIAWWIACSPADPRTLDARRLRHNWIGRETRDLDRMVKRHKRETDRRVLAMQRRFREAEGAERDYHEAA